MEVLLLTPHFAPHFEGGTEFVARAQARELARLGHRVRILSGTDRPHAGRDRETANIDGVEVTFLPRLPEETYDLSLERPRLGRLIEEELRGAELVHVHHWSTLPSDVVRRLARRVPVVVTLHDLFTTCPRFFRVPVGDVTKCPEPGDAIPCARCVQPDAPGLELDSLTGMIEARHRWMAEELGAAGRIVFPSLSHASNVLRFFPELTDAHRVISHGLCAAELSTPDDAHVTATTWTGEGRLRVLFLGHRTPLKGVGDLVASMALLSPELRARLELCLLGGEVDAGFDDDLRARAGDLRLRFLGGYRVEELRGRVAEAGGAHLAALPSRVQESYGLVLDEAQALGLPAWVSDRGAPLERVGSAGRVLPAEDPAAWAAALAEVLESPSILESERRALPGSVRSAHDAALELQALYRELTAPTP